MTIVIKTQMGALVFNPTRINVTSGCEVINFDTRHPSCEDLLGEYKNKERAQEVVDEILNQLNEIGTLSGCAGLPVYCYEMPKE